MKNLSKLVALAATLLVSAMFMNTASAANPFSQPSQISTIAGEEGKCGNDKKADKKEEGKCGQENGKKEDGKCGANNAKNDEAKCGEKKDEKHEGKCGEKKADKKEGKCGESKCGGK